MDVCSLEDQQQIVAVLHVLLFLFDSTKEWLQCVKENLVKPHQQRPVSLRKQLGKQCPHFFWHIGMQQSMVRSAIGKDKRKDTSHPGNHIAAQGFLFFLLAHCGGRGDFVRRVNLLSALRATVVSHLANAHIANCVAASKETRHNLAERGEATRAIGSLK
jgi:hypothetical protein